MAINRALFAGDDPTPDSVKRRMALADLLRQQGSEYEHVDSPLEAIGSLLNSGAGYFAQMKAQKDQDEGIGRRKTAQQSIANMLLGGGAGASAPTSMTGPISGAMASASPAPSSPAGGAMAASGSAPSDQSGYIRSGLVSRGLPEHVADAFLANFQDESGMNPGINERKPLVPGSRGGFGLYQLTGPRRTAYEGYASSRSVDPSNVDAQLDFLVGELGVGGDKSIPGFGSESRAAQGILSAPDTATAAQRIVTDFLRPSPEHRAERAGRYASLGGQPVQVASADPSIGMAAATGGRPTPQPSANNQQVAQLLTQGGPPAPPSMTNGVSQEQIAQLLSDPYTEDLGQQLLQQMLGDRQKQAEAQAAWQRDVYKTQEQRQYDRMTEAEKRAYDDRVRQEGYRREDDRNQYLDAREGSRDARSDMESDRNFDRQVRQDQKPQIVEVYDETTGRQRKGYMNPEGEFVPVGGVEAAKNDNGITIGPDGTVQIGGQGMKLTEGQSKDLNYYIRGNAALDTLRQHEEALSSGGQRFANGVPIGGNYLTSEEFKLGNQAGREFLASILRKDTGAAITKQEEDVYGQFFLPQPGDTPAVIEQKRASRQRALEAMRVGLGTATPLADAPVTQNPGSLVPGSDADPLGLR